MAGLTSYTNLFFSLSHCTICICTLCSLNLRCKFSYSYQNIFNLSLSLSLSLALSLSLSIWYIQLNIVQCVCKPYIYNCLCFYQTIYIYHIFSINCISQSCCTYNVSENWKNYFKKKGQSKIWDLFYLWYVGPGVEFYSICDMQGQELSLVVSVISPRVEFYSICDMPGQELSFAVSVISQSRRWVLNYLW